LNPITTITKISIPDESSERFMVYFPLYLFEGIYVLGGWRKQMRNLLASFGEHKEEWKMMDTTEIIFNKEIYHWILPDMNYFIIFLD
jgi:hypothetical protein